MSHWLMRLTTCRAIGHSALGQLSANYWLGFFFTCSVFHVYPVIATKKSTRVYSLLEALPPSFTAPERVE